MQPDLAEKPFMVTKTSWNDEEYTIENATIYSIYKIDPIQDDYSNERIFDSTESSPSVPSDGVVT
jgi:hypothetical protein